jgi:hypothetical protein
MDANSIQFQALITFLMPMAMQLAKRSQAKSLAWIDQSKPVVCIFTSAVSAILTSTGIQVVHVAHSLTITWPDTTTIIHGLVALAVSTIIQFAGQHALYDGFWRHIISSPSNQPAKA